jgi:hypothetical protein
MISAVSERGLGKRAHSRHWWLTHENAKVALTVVDAALDRLISQGVVRMRVLADGTTIYSGRVKGQCEQSSDTTP